MLKFTHPKRNSILNNNKMPFFRISLIIDADGDGIGKPTVSQIVVFVWYSLFAVKFGNIYQYLKFTTYLT